MDKNEFIRHLQEIAKDTIGLDITNHVQGCQTCTILLMACQTTIQNHMKEKGETDGSKEYDI